MEKWGCPKKSEEEEREAGTESNGVGRMAPYREKLLSKPRPFLRKTKIDALLVPTYVIPSKRTVPKEKTNMGTPIHIYNFKKIPPTHHSPEYPWQNPNSEHRK